MIGCKMMFNAAEEYFIIAEVPGVSGYMVLWGFSLTLAGSVLASRWLILQTVDLTFNIVGKLLGCVAAIVYLLLRASLYRPLRGALHRWSPICIRLNPIQAKFCAAYVRIVSLGEWSYKTLSVRLKSGFICARRTFTSYASPVIKSLLPKFSPMFAFAVFALTAVLTFIQSKLAVLCTFTLTKLAAVLIVCSPRLYAILESLRPMLRDRTTLLKVTQQFGLRQRDVIAMYLVRLVKPSFEMTLKYFKMKTSKSRRKDIKKPVPLNGVMVH